MRLSNPSNNKQTSKSTAWKMSLIGGACACLAVFLINLGVTIWSAMFLEGSQNGIKTGRRIIYKGSCSTSRTLSVVIHLIINIFGSILLGASNYGMQCLSAPTRADVNKAHAKQGWLDIGILSFRNLRRVSRKKAVLWWLFNSVVFSSLTTHEYEVYTINGKFELLENEVGYHLRIDDSRSQLRIERAKAGQLDNLTALECINEYAISFQTKRTDVLLVVDPSSGSDWVRTRDVDSTHSLNVRWVVDAYQGFEWICPSAQPCRGLLPGVKSQSDNWRPYGNRVKYCFSQSVPQTCRLNFDIHIAGIILGVNAIKAAILAYLRGWTQPFVIHEKRRHWAVAVSKGRWTASFVIYSVALGVSIFFLTWGIFAISGPHDLTTLWNLGFGAAVQDTLISGLGWETWGDEALIWNIILCNLPQLIFSLLYFQYNGLFTCMAAAKEWSDFGHKRNSLRVSSNPRGEQRSRYFLQLPYRFSIPLLVASILMHWMLSQSIFLVAVEKTDFYRPGSLDWAILTCGYSPIAIIFVIVTSILMATVVVITACRRLPTPIPVAGSCSVAIAAACHHPDGIPQPEASLFPLQWGVIWRQGDGSYQELTNHCGFSPHPVERPQEGVIYH
ncbi:uncharacterized protein FOBCDRAFT_140710 [Fusarium oxysporum Fo47]|uniref:uncharacterized protein n=1 Tax=Fusarium oxysporum Fo47 TaxID=660027 RepID=UPI002869DD39|nr:uncharacterized protein FOBCDRAFT_140710 [Fusarium oxysporum Fo47]WJG35913.1 hypothetical protein FOBCDRAFT_140710 [Fusarium oxysporum Fo47]